MRQGRFESVASFVHPVLFGMVRFVLWILGPTRASNRTFRSLWTGTPILNMAVNCRSERLLGIHADSLVTESYVTTNEFTYNLSGLARWRLVRLLLPYFIMIWASLRYQRFHFYCDRGMLPSLKRFCFNVDELKLLHRMGKEIYFWTYGADVRTRERTLDLGEPNCCTECPSISSGCVCDEITGRANISAISRYATAVFSKGDMVTYVPDSCSDLFYWPIDLSADGGKRYAPVYTSAQGTGALRIVHATNHSHFKGTRYLSQAVAQLQREGYQLELEIVTGVTNKEALNICSSADIIFDQCLIGYHGYFALEGMALGKAVLCFVRDRERSLLMGEQCPIINTHVDTLKEDIRRLIQDRSQLREIGIRSRRYIEEYYSMEAFAARLGRIYTRLGKPGQNLEKLLQEKSSCAEPPRQI